ncbi:MAG: Crp/Fnr family transcriptional regulator [Actinobacteria bacterium]|nr:Crp/Fnr family transcriptional regulator [Actinomycetota bacterium]
MASPSRRITDTGDCGLATRGFLAHLGPHARETLLGAGRPLRFSAHETLLREGEQSQHVLLIVSGRVKIVATAPNGYEAVLAIRGPGDLIGELACIDNMPRSATVAALGPVHTRIMPRVIFDDFLTDHPVAAKVLVRMVAWKLRCANRRRLEFSAYPVRLRLALVLLELEEWYGRSGHAGRDLDLALSQTDLAGLVGASIDSVSKAIRALSQARVIATGRRRVTILRLDELREIAAPIAARCR